MGFFSARTIPGHLKSSEEVPLHYPKDLALAIDEQLDTDEADVSSFIALVNSATIFR